MTITRNLFQLPPGPATDRTANDEKESTRRKYNFRYDLNITLGSLRDEISTRPLGQFLRYLSFLQTRISWSGLDFRDRTILEIGCGPLLGWTPLAV